MEYFTNKYKTNNEKEFYVNHNQLGAPTSPQTANQLQEATSRLNAGLKNVELSLISPDVFESIPKQHFEEVRRLGELTGSKASLHFPAQIDLAGFKGGQQGVAWSERERKQAEYQLRSGIDKAADLGKNTIINVHSSGGVPAYEWQSEDKLGTEEGRPEEDKRKIYVMDRDSGNVATAPEYEEKEYFHGKHPWQPKDRIKTLNKNQWDEEKLRLFNYEKEKAELNDRLNQIQMESSPLEQGNKKGVLTEDEQKRMFRNRDQLKVIEDHIEEINVHLDSQMQDLHHKFERYTEKEPKKMFRSKYGKQYDELVKLSKEERSKGAERKREKISLKMQEVYEKNKGDLQKTIQSEEFQRLQGEMKNLELVKREKLLNILQQMPTPKRFVTTDEFAKDNISKTISDSAMYAYDRYGKDAPVIAVENVMPDWTLGRGKSLKEAVLESRKKFSDKLVKEKKVSRPKANQMADKLIGATWDVG